nr:MFS transporter [Allobranchiibius sp. GilTou38]
MLVTVDAHRDRDFWLLWAGQGLSMVGSEVVIMAAPFVAVIVLHASALQIGILSAVQTLAFLLITLPAGIVVDRVGARRTMWWANLARTGLAGTTALLLASRHLTFGTFVILTAVAGCSAVLFEVAYPTFVPQIVDAKRLTGANSRLTGTQSMAQVLGPPSGGALVGAVGPAGAFLVDSLSFVVSLITLGLIRKPQCDNRIEKSTAGVRSRSVVAGMTFVWRDRILRAGMLWSGCANIFVVMVETMGVLFLLHELRFSAAVVGALLAAGAAGGVVGAVLVRRVNRLLGSGRATWLMMTAFSLPGLVIPLTGHGPRAVLFGIGSASWAMSATITSVNLLTYRQGVAPGGMLGQVNAAVRWVTWGTLPAGGVLGGLLASRVGVRKTLWVAVVGGCCSGLWLLFSPLRTMRELPAS